MDWFAAGLLAIFDGARGAFFLTVLIALMIGGVILLVVNLAPKAGAPAQPVWEPVPDDAPTVDPTTSMPAGAPKKPTAPRRRT